MKRNRFESLERFFVEVIRTPGSELGHSRGVRLFLGFLKQLSRLYGAAMQLRLFLYAKGIFRHHTLGCQVISVGNLTVGGTGKTPVVEIFARELQKAGRRVAILSRGYKKRELPVFRRLLDRLTLRNLSRPPRVVSDGTELLLDCDMSGDEPYMLASNLQDVAVLVDKNRVKSGRYAIGRLGCDTLILDDGFQYLSLKHWIEIVLVDKTNPFGNGYILPRGILRESVRNIRRADVIFITKSDGRGTELRDRLRALNTRAEIIECRHCPRHLQNVETAERKDLDYLRGRRLVVLSGIADPSGFEREIVARGGMIVEALRYADHHRFSQQEILDAIHRARQIGAEALLTTEKDAVRFPKLARCDVPIYFLRVDIEILSGAQDFHDCIARVCFKRPPENGHAPLG
jgi:tetraacyldisaccharide 4'-kinase